MKRTLALMSVAACLALSPVAAVRAHAGEADYSNWEKTTSVDLDSATSSDPNQYARSATEVVDGALHDIATEVYKYGSDGYMYVTVSWGDGHLDYFKFEYDYNPGPGDPPDPFGEIGQPGSGPFVPPDPAGFKGGINYGDLGLPPDGGCTDSCTPPDGDGDGDGDPGGGGGGGGGVGGAPEPATWLLMLTGVGGIGGMLRARRRTQPVGPGL